MIELHWFVGVEMLKAGNCFSLVFSDERYFSVFKSLILGDQMDNHLKHLPVCRLRKIRAIC